MRDWTQAFEDPALQTEARTRLREAIDGLPPDYRTAFPDVYYVPMIAGQNPGYIVKALEAYKSGERNHPSMRAIAATLSGQDMADLAVYYGTVAK